MTEHDFVTALHTTYPRAFGVGVFADWLEDRGDPQVGILRSFAALTGHGVPLYPDRFYVGHLGLRGFTEREIADMFTRLFPAYDSHQLYTWAPVGYERVYGDHGEDYGYVTLAPQLEKLLQLGWTTRRIRKAIADIRDEDAREEYEYALDALERRHRRAASRRPLRGGLSRDAATRRAQPWR